jgi:hypothetical protein
MMKREVVTRFSTLDIWLLVTREPSLTPRAYRGLGYVVGDE